MDTYKFELARETLEYPTHGEYAVPTNPYHQDHIMNSYDPSYYYVSPILWDYFESSDHNVHNHPYRDYQIMLMLRVQVLKKKINELTNRMVKTMK